MKPGLKERAARLTRDVSAVYVALRDAETPIAAKVLAAITVAYALSPIDLVPDFIPVLGYIDDIIILPLLVAATVKLIPDGVMARCREKARGMWADGKPKRWYFALPIVALWVLVAWLVVKALFIKG